MANAITKPVVYNKVYYTNVKKLQLTSDTVKAILTSPYIAVFTDVVDRTSK